MEQITKTYRRIQAEIEKRLGQFRTLWVEGTEQDLFAEVVFCLLTPQSNAEFCWRIVQVLVAEGYLLQATYEQLLGVLQHCRFKNKRAGYILEARTVFFQDGSASIRAVLEPHNTVYSKRDWLVTAVKGFGYKEASHFLRNIGLGEDIAILDRHILKYLMQYAVIDEIPYTLTKIRYQSIEDAMKRFSQRINIPLSHLDLLFWYTEHGTIFK